MIVSAAAITGDGQSGSELSHILHSPREISCANNDRTA